MGLEPTTYWTTTSRSNQLSYTRHMAVLFFDLSTLAYFTLNIHLLEHVGDSGARPDKLTKEVTPAYNHRVTGCGAVG